MVPTRLRALLRIACTAGLLAGAHDVTAQETIASDRPGTGSGAYVLGAGTIQLEVGTNLSGRAISTPSRWAKGS